MHVYYNTIFEKSDLDTQVKIQASGHYVPSYAGAYLLVAMSERVIVGRKQTDRHKVEV